MKRLIYLVVIIEMAIDTLDLSYMSGKVATLYLLLLVANSQLIQDRVKEAYNESKTLKHFVAIGLMISMLSEKRDLSTIDIIQLSIVGYGILLAVTKSPNEGAALLVAALIINRLLVQKEFSKIDRVNNSVILDKNEKLEIVSETRYGNYILPIATVSAILASCYWNSLNREVQFGGGYSNLKFLLG